MKEIIKWLLEGEPWVEYRTRIDLLGQSENEPEVTSARKQMIDNPRIQSLIGELKDWPGVVLSSHKSASQPFHKLSFLADLGLRKDDPYINEIVDKILKHQSDEGPFQLSTNIPKHFGGSGKDEGAWALCDAPIIVYSLVKFGYDKDERVQKAIGYLVSLVRGNGWPCTVSKELGKFRGPGRKDDPCPYATLVMLKMLSQLHEWKESREVHVGAECLLGLWEKSRELHPYMFYMGTDFRKTKAPLFWYDIVNVLDTLSKFDWLKNDERLEEMLEVVKSKTDSEGKYTPESEWKAWRGWDFGQKKQPSRWLTYVILKILTHQPSYDLLTRA
jgi:hypothetical protein